MTVTWTSGYSIKEALPFVEWGPKGGHQMLSPAGTLTFGRNRMCGRSVNLTFHFANDCLNAGMNYEYNMFAFRCVTTCYCRFTSTDCWVAWSWLYSYKFLEGIVAWCSVCDLHRLFQSPFLYWFYFLIYFVTKKDSHILILDHVADTRISLDTGYQMVLTFGASLTVSVHHLILDKILCNVLLSSGTWERCGSLHIWGRFFAGFLFQFLSVFNLITFTSIGRGRWFRWVW